MAKKDKVLKKILQEIGGENIVGAQVEGSFYRSDLFHDICEVINRNYDYKSMEFPYAREEVYFSTIVWNWKNRGKKIHIYVNGRFTYIAWDNEMKIEIDDIRRLQEENARFFR